MVLRGDPAHKIVNPLLYRYEEVHAVWQQVTAPVLWIEASESDTLKRMSLDPAHLAERRAAFRTLRLVRMEQAGHMLHHDQPGLLAGHIEQFLG